MWAVDRRCLSLLRGARLAPFTLDIHSFALLLSPLTSERRTHKRPDAHRTGGSTRTSDGLRGEPGAEEALRIETRGARGHDGRAELASLEPVLKDPGTVGAGEEDVSVRRNRKLAYRRRQCAGLAAAGTSKPRANGCQVRPLSTLR